MASTVRVICVASVLVACGGGGDDPDLVGKWLVLNADQSCAAGYSFTADGHFERDLACQREDGGFDVMALAGTYAVDSSNLDLNITSASCPIMRQSATISYQLSKNELRVSSPDGLEVLERVKDASSGGTGTSATYGCFSDDGTFTPMPVRKL